ncbi:MAG: hypothetical protein GXP62_21110 [Oligoflexia bacterium]|nr:hypothetical protein [Oligoflexia bacterium]
MLALPPALLTLPAPGDRTMATIQRKLRLLALRRLLSQDLGAPSLPPGLAQSITALRRVLVAAVRRNKAAVLDLLGGPDLLTWLLCLEAGLRTPRQSLAEVGPTLLAGLASAGLVAEPITWEHPVAPIIGSDRAWVFDPPAAALAVLPAGVEVQLHDGRRVPLPELACSRPFHPLALGLTLSTLDTNPLAMVEAHPDKQGNALSLGEHPVQTWVDALRAALEAVQTGLPEWAAELPLSLSRLVPVGWQPQRHLSASYREAPGLAYLSLHDRTLTLAEAIVHETQHSRLNSLCWLDCVLHNAWTEWTSSPVRPDLRPLMGVLLAAHAFVPVAALHARLAEMDHPLSQRPEFPHRRAEVLATNTTSLRTLAERARPTAIGRRLLTDLLALHDTLLALAPCATIPTSPEPVP